MVGSLSRRRKTLISLRRQSVKETKGNSDLKPNGPRGWGLDIGQTTLFRKNTRVTERETEEINNTGCDGLPESSQDTHMNDNSERQKETTDRKMEVLSAKTKTRIGLWKVRTIYEAGKLAQVTAGMRRYSLQNPGISESKWTGYRASTGETVLYSGREDDQHHEGVAVIPRKGIKKYVMEWKPINKQADEDQNEGEAHQHHHHPALCTGQRQ